MFRPEAIAARTRRAPAPRPIGLRRWSGSTTAWLAGTMSALLLLAAALIPSPEVLRGRAVVRYEGLQVARSPREGVVGSFLVQPGDRVSAGDPIAVLSSPSIEATYAQRRASYRDAVRRMLREPSQPSVRADLGRAREALQRAAEAKEHQVVRAPTSGSVLSLRTHVGASVAALAPVCEIRGRQAPSSVVALFPGNARPRIRKGAKLRVVFDEFPKAPLDTTVDAASDNVLAPRDAAAFTSSYLSEAFPTGSSVVTVHAPLDVDARAQARGLQLYEGMTAEVELVVRDRSILARILAPGGLL